jgi:hypothetical protein
MRRPCYTNELYPAVSHAPNTAATKTINGQEPRIPSSKTAKRSATFSAICAGSHWAVSLSLFCSPALMHRSRDTDRSTYMTLHATFSMVALTSDQSCDQVRFRHGAQVFRGARQGRDTTAGLASVSDIKTGQAELVNGRSAPMAFSGGRRSGRRSWWIAAARRY